MDLKMYRLNDLDPDDPVHPEDIVRSIPKFWTITYATSAVIC